LQQLESNIINALGRSQITDQSMFSAGHMQRGLQEYGPAPGVQQVTYRNPQDGIQPYETSNGGPHHIGPSELDVWGHRGGPHTTIYHNNGISRSGEFGSANPLFNPSYLEIGARPTGTYQHLNAYHSQRLDNGLNHGGPFPHLRPVTNYFPPQGLVGDTASPGTHQPELVTGKPHP
jgi:hypothetical protein